MPIDQNVHSANTMPREQLHYAEEVRALMPLRSVGPKPMACVRTYGCQQNVSDSERMKGMLSLMGFDFTDSPEEADFILFNTCAVREHAEDRVFGNVGALKNLKERRPSLIIGLCGCMMQQEHVAERIRKSYPYVSLVFGTHVIHRLPELFYRTITDGRRVFETPDEEGRIVEGIPVRRDGEFKAWLPIMYGCNNVCSYCIVPYVRGRERSRSPQVILKEARELAAAGYKEITLLGQNVNSYGRGLPDGISFADLIREVNKIPGDFKIRFMTSHPKDATHDLIDAMADCDKVAHHLHLPFQSGNDRVLKAMNRKYTRAQYLNIVRYAKERIPDLSLTSDVIVGFPGETYEEFSDTVSLIREVGFTSLFTFIYSPRKGTPAAEMDDPVPAEEKSRWMGELLAAQEAIASRRCGAMVGQTVPVLCEGEKSPGLLTGRTEGNVMIDFPGEASLVGQYVRVRVNEAGNWILHGELVKASNDGHNKNL